METNIQEPIITPPKKRGRPSKSESIQSTSQFVKVPVKNSTANDIIDNDNNEVELLKQQLQQLQEENLKLKQIAETVTITNTKPLINCSDDEINSLYVNYITTHETAHDNALVIEADGKVIIPKSYYVVG